MSWFTSLLGGFLSGSGYSGLGQVVGGQGLQSTWGSVGRMIGTLSSTGGGGTYQPQSPQVQTSWDTPPQPLNQRRYQRRFQGFNLPTQPTNPFNINNFIRQGGLKQWEM